ncbi:DUF6351 family protein [Ramlibacter solisilvae]|nr:hypothetical protein [Ramlibacter tataouinensis]
MRSLLPFALALALAGCAHGSADPQESAPRAASCPAELPQDARCLQGRDSAGAFYLVAVPAQWNGTLVLHAHGGPTLGAPTLERTAEDLKRWAVVVKAGYAWAGSSFRQGGVAVRAAAEDTERLRRIFRLHVAQPRLTLLHGQSWGAAVAAVGASMYTDDGQGRRPYNAVLLSSGVLAGSQSYDFRLDLRVLYQALCANHPRPEEGSYPLWMGLPPGMKLEPGELRRRVDACLGLDRAAALRTPEQQRKLRTLTGVLNIPADSIPGHLSWATWHFQDIAQRMGGRSVFGNEGVRYRGSDDDAAINAAVARYRADPAAVADFAADVDPDGRIPVPVLTVHGIGDPTAFVEMDHGFRATMARAGTAGHLVQTFTEDRTHSYLSDVVYVTLLAELSRWARGGAMPTPAGIAEHCRGFEPAWGAGCRFRPDYQPQPLDTRVAPRG